MIAPAQPEESELSSVDGEWRGFRYAVLLVALYSVAHIFARVLASPNLGEDDPVTNVLVQSLEAGYSVYQPPLFEWLNWALQQATGPTLLGFQLIKYALLIATVGALYIAAFEVTRNVVWSVITAEALTLIYHVGWRFHEGFTGLISAMLCSALALVFVLRIVRSGRLSDFIFLGLALGFGLLSEHSFMMGLVALLLAGALVEHVRTRLFGAKLIVTFVIAALLVSPYYWWILSDGIRVDQLLKTETIFTNSNPNRDFWKLIRKTAGAPFGFFWSLLLFLLFASWRRVVDHFRVRLLPEISWDGRPLLQFLGWYALISYVLLFIAGMAFSYVGYTNHDLLSFMPPVLVLLFALIYLIKPSAEEMRRWAVISLAIIVFAFAARLANMFVMEPFCKICRWGIPYQELAAQMNQAGFRNGRILVLDSDLAGNLRLYFPNARIVIDTPTSLKGRIEAGASARQTAIVWQVGGRHGIRGTNAAFRNRLRRIGIDDPVTELNAPWRHLFRPTGYRHTVWNFVLTNAGK